MYVEPWSCLGNSEDCFLILLSLEPEDTEAKGQPSSPEKTSELLTEKERPAQTGLIIIILLSVFFLIAVILIVVFVFCYRKRLKEKFPKKEVTLQNMETMRASLNLLPSEPNTPNQTDGTTRTFSYAAPRRRLSSTGSTNSTAPLIRYGTGSYRSRFSSGVSSRIDSNIAEGKERLSGLGFSKLI